MTKQPFYYAVWVGKEDDYSWLYSTTRSERVAKQAIKGLKERNVTAFYTTEQGPIVPLGGKSTNTETGRRDEAQGGQST